MSLIKQAEERIRKTCQLANPKLLELSFGCFLSVKGRGDYRTKMVFVDKSVAGNYICSPWVLGAGTTTVKPENVEILGRPIRLADVLLAFQGNKKAPIGIDMNGYFLDADDDATTVFPFDSKTRWNLLNDDLSQQSQETILFLDTLLTADSK